MHALTFVTLLWEKVQKLATLHNRKDQVHKFGVKEQERRLPAAEKMWPVCLAFNPFYDHKHVRASVKKTLNKGAKCVKNALGCAFGVEKREN